MATPLHTPATSGDLLAERYAYAVTRHLPEDQRADVADELRASIADRAESLLHERPGLDHAAAERIAVEELGDPVRLAATYHGRPQQLVGPSLYPAYVRVLRSILVTAVPAVTVVVGLTRGFTGESAVDAVGGAVWTAFTVAVHVAFWVTVVFALLEHGVGGEEARSAIDVAWSPDQLPDLPRTRGSLAETVASVAWLGLLGAAVVWQQLRSPVTASGERVPILDPDLWSFWLPLVLVLLLAEIAFEVVKYLTALRRPGLEILLGALFAAPVLYLAVTDRLLNPAAVAEAQERWSGFDPDFANTVVAVAAVVIWLWDSVESWRRTERAPTC